MLLVDEKFTAVIVAKLLKPDDVINSTDEIELKAV